MNVFTMIVAIVALGTVSSVLVRWMKLREKQLAAGAGEGGETVNKLATLEERVRVLEKIVTDKTRALKEEIDAL